MNKVHVHSLRKHEILRRKQLISLLFRSGIRVKGDFLKMVYADLKPEHNCFPGIPAILFAVSKKTVPSAVGRNRIKRMMKEAYRIEKSLIPWIGKNPHDDGQDEVLCIAFLYSGSRKTFPDLEAFREEIRRLMQSIKLS